MKKTTILKKTFVLLIAVLMVLTTMVTTGAGESQGAILEVSTDKTLYIIGEPVIIFLTNVGDENLSAGGPIITIYDSEDEIVYQEACYCWYDLEPGEYVTWPAWNQTNQQGDQVPVGGYVVEGFLSAYDENYVDDANIFISNDESSSPPNNPDTPTGPTDGEVDVTYTYFTSSIDPENDDVFFRWDWDDGTFSNWLGPYTSGESASASHAWSESGIYCIKVKAKDSNGEESGWSDELCVDISGGGNNPPDRPSKPSGPSTGEPRVEYVYSTSTTDPDGDMVRYGWEWTQDNTVDSWTDLYNSDVECSVKLGFDEIGTYYLRVMAEDEHGAQSGFSSALTIVISAGCIEYKGFYCCPIGENTMLNVEGDEMVVSDMLDGDGFTVDIPTSNDVYRCDIKDALGLPSVSYTGKIGGSFEGSAFSLEMTIGGDISSGSSDTSYGVYPVGFQGSSSGAPSIIAWVKDDDCEGNWEIAFRKTLEPTSSLDLGYVEFPIVSYGVYPVGFQGSSSGAPSIIMYTGGECSDVLWTQGDWGVDRLGINALMVTYVHTCDTCGNEYPLLCTCADSDHAGFLNEFSLSVSGVSEITVSDMWAKHNGIPLPGNVDGPGSGKKSETYNFSITPDDSDDAYSVCLWDLGQGEDHLIEGVYPVGFQGSSSGAPSIISWSTEEDGEFVVKVRVFDMTMGVSPWVVHEISITKSKVYSPLIQIYLKNLLEHFPFLEKILNQII
jgi:hypothetical protein